MHGGKKYLSTKLRSVIYVYLPIESARDFESRDSQHKYFLQWGVGGGVFGRGGISFISGSKIKRTDINCRSSHQGRLFRLACYMIVLMERFFDETFRMSG